LLYCTGTISSSNVLRSFDILVVAKAEAQANQDLALTVFIHSSEKYIIQFSTFAIAL
jgi:hypothetical protein